MVRAVAGVLREHPVLEAVTIDCARGSVSLATLGRVDSASISQKVTERISTARSKPARGCGISVGGCSCTHCELPLSQQELSQITIRSEGDRLTIARVTCPTAPSFWRWREFPLPRFVPRELEMEEDHDHEGEWKWQLGCAILCGVFGVVAFLVNRNVSNSGALIYFFYGVAYLAGSWFAAEELRERWRKERTLDVHFLMLAVALGSAAVNQWNEGVILLFLFSFAGALEHYSLERTQREIKSLFREAPKTATLVDAAGVETEFPVERLASGMTLLVKPGSQFPVDAEILSGETAADESNLTGEAAPVGKSVGDSVLAGTLNLWGAVRVNVTRPAAESALQKIIRLIREAHHQKAPVQRFTDKFSGRYTYAVLIGSFVMFFVWWLGFDLPAFHATDPESPELTAFYRTMTLLVVSSPCALVLSIPSAVLAAIAWGARRGILIRGGAAVEKLAEVKVVAMDKTGTLTTGELRVEKIESHPPGRESLIEQLAFSMERLSTHPLARAVTRHGAKMGLKALELGKFSSIAGLGLEADHAGKLVRLGKREWVLEQSQQIGFDSAAAGVSEVWVVWGEVTGRIQLRDDVRPQARAVVDALRAAGLRTVVLTGDRKSAGEFLRNEINVDEVRAELRPDEKVAAIRELSAGGSHVAMVGDGVNDAPSLAAAHVGVAMGARGSDAALEQADVVLMHDRLENFLSAFRLSQAARRIIRQNLVISLGTVVVLVVFALVGGIPLPVGVIGHEGSTVIVVLNSLRLLMGPKAEEA
jgi:Cd2+/Zn2+-exporting ATPase